MAETRAEFKKLILNYKAPPPQVKTGPISLHHYILPGFGGSPWDIPFLMMQSLVPRAFVIMLINRMRSEVIFGVSGDKSESP